MGRIEGVLAVTLAFPNGNASVIVLGSVLRRAAMAVRTRTVTTLMPWIYDPFGSGLEVHSNFTMSRTEEAAMSNLFVGLSPGDPDNEGRIESVIAFWNALSCLD